MTIPSIEEQDAQHERSRRPLITIPQSRLGRVVFGLAIGLWFVVLLIPFGCFFLATGGQIRILHNNIPDVETHPWFQTSLVMEIEQRGFQITRSVIVNPSETEICLETYVNYVLWQSDNSASNVVYCDCYERNAPSAQWLFVGTASGVCGVNTP